MIAKPVVVFIPGMMCDERVYAPQIAALQDDYEIHVADISQHNSISALAAAVLDSTESAEMSVVGLSMGGIVAMEMLGQAPERMSRLALLDTNHLAETPERQQARFPQISRALNGELRTILVDEMKPLYLSSHTPNQDEILHVVLDMADDLGKDVFVRQSQALATRPDASETLKRFTGATLVLSGADDRLCTPERHQEMADLLSNSKLVCVPRCGHISPLESPETVTNEIKSWLVSA